ncbi:MAG: glycosyltransferase family 2 protein [Oscillospiraceae bacterium]|nr:glycosyltransferase family 2 protein [Oscillospiraceae bacterium]
MKPVVSVIVPIYNQEKYIEECLRSLLTQATDEVEFLLINDGSTDRSPALCREITAEYPAARVRIIDQPNHGLLKTRAIGLAASEGAYIVSVDSDDALLPGAIAALLSAIDKRRSDVILYNATSDPEHKTPLFAYDFPGGTVFRGEDKYPLYRLSCVTDKMNNIWAKCIRRELLEDPEVYDDIDGISNGEDLYQTLVVLDRAQQVEYLDAVLYYWRKTVGSMSRSYNPKFFPSEKKVCLRRMAYAAKWSRGDDELTHGARVWICKILRDVTRKAFISDMPWEKIKAEIAKLRADDFYRAYYLHTDVDKNKRDVVLKSSFPVMRLWKILYGLKGR